MIIFRANNKVGNSAGPSPNQRTIKLEIEPSALITKDLDNEDIWDEAGDEPLARSRGK